MSLPIPQRLRQLRAQRSCDVVPKGFFTPAQWAAKWRVEHSTAAKFCRQAVTAGLMEFKNLRVMTPRGAYPAHLYREVK